MTALTANHKSGRLARACGKRLTVAAALLAVLLIFAGQFGVRQYWEDQRIYASWQVQRHAPTGFCRLLDRAGGLRAWGRGETCVAALESARVDEGLRPEGRHLVVMLHGLGRTPLIFRKMKHALDEAGYEAVAISYPSLTKDVGDHAAHLERLLDGLEEVERVSFVTHSLGGLVLRETLARDGDWQDRLALGRAVMLAPPNQGSELARTLNAAGPFHFFGGPSAGQLGQGESFAAPPPLLEFGVIAGGTTDGRGFNPLLSANNDGIVTVAETRLGGASDFLVLPVIHTVIASAPETIAATLSFLVKGRFS